MPKTAAKATTTNGQAEEPAVVITSRDELDAALRRFTAVSSKYADRSKKLHDELEKVERKHARYMDRWAGEMYDLDQAIIRYAREHKAELLEREDGKTAVLPSGKIEYRAGRARVVVDDEEAVVQRLRQLGHDELIRVKESVDKTAVMKRPEIADAVDGIAIVEGLETITVKPLAS